MPSIRKIYNNVQQRRRFRSRSRSPSPSSESPQIIMSSQTPKADCRACTLGLFCYDHVESPTTSAAPQQPETEHKSGQANTARPQDRQSTSDSVQPPSQGVFEKSCSDENTNSQDTAKAESKHGRDPSLPSIQVNGVEIPYWVK